MFLCWEHGTFNITRLSLSPHLSRRIRLQSHIGRGASTTACPPPACPSFKTLISKPPVVSSALDPFKLSIARQVVRAIPELSSGQVLEGIHGGTGKGSDFSLAIPRFRLQETPERLCEKVLHAFQADPWISEATRRGALLHFKANSATLLGEVFQRTFISPDDPDTSSQRLHGCSDSGFGRTVLIEYSSPNIAKPFHVGHLRSTILGQFLANLHLALGWKVISMNYLGDWGTQFGMLALGYHRFGSNEALSQDPIKHLYDIYVLINAASESDPSVKEEAAQYFKRLENGDEAALSLWRKWRDLSIDAYSAQYSSLNIHFDEYVGESEVDKQTLAQVLSSLTAKGLIIEEDGAKLVNLEEWGLGKPVLLKRDGSSIYLARDVGAAIERYERYQFDKMLYVVSSQQSLHLAQVFKIIEILGYPWAKSLEHVDFGLVLGMSTRKGTAVFLADIIKEATAVMHACMQKDVNRYARIEDPIATSREIGLSAIKIQDMQAKRTNNYRFSWDRMTTFEGDTGPYLQYTHVRLCSIIRKNKDLLPIPATIDLSPLATHVKAHELAMLAASYSEVLRTALKTRDPSGIVTFAMRLSHTIGGAMDTFGVKGEAERGSLQTARTRLALFIMARTVLGSAMRLLSLTPLERM